jgi:hypothetical protein
VFRTDHKRAMRSMRRARTALLSVSLIAACGDDSGASKTDADGSVIQPDGATPDAGRSDTGVGQTDSGPGTDGGKDSAVGPGPGTAPTLTAVVARQVGRSGADLRLEVTGSDPDKDIKTVKFSVYDSAGAKIGEDHELDLATAITMTSGMSAVTLTDALVMPSTSTPIDFKTVQVSLADGRGVESDGMMATIAAQPKVAKGAACDATFVSNRCEEGLGCKGAAGAQKCADGEAPTLSAVGYFDDALGLRIVFAGSDPDGDVKSYKVRYLDENGSEVVWDDDNDVTTPDASFFSGPLGSAEGATDFFFRFPPGDNVPAKVKKVGITVSDTRATGNSSAEMITGLLGPAPSKNSGVVCDPRGFDICKPSTMAPLVCAPSGNTNKCTPLATARTNACNAAPALTLGGTTSVKGSITLVSLWDPPTSCTSSAPNQADSLVKLVLTETKTVTLSTDNPYTSFDTDLYAIRSCSEAPTLYDPRPSAAMTDFWCLPDQRDGGGAITSVKAKLVLNNLEAGTYFVVVESSPSAALLGDHFEIDVEAE